MQPKTPKNELDNIFFVRKNIVTAIVLLSHYSSWYLKWNYVDDINMVM